MPTPSGWPSGYSVTARKAGTVLVLRYDARDLDILSVPASDLGAACELLRVRAWEESDVNGSDVSACWSVVAQIGALGAPTFAGFAPLDSAGLVPSSMLPAGGTQGPEGPAGPQGIPGPPGPSALTLARATAPQTINGTAYRDITGLSFALAQATTYAFRFLVTFRSATTTTGFGFSVSGPASPALLNYRVDYQTVANATAGAPASRKDVAYDAMAFTTATVTANADLLAVIDGVIRTGALGGTLAARVRSELANNDLTIRPESIGILTTFS